MNSRFTINPGKITIISSTDYLFIRQFSTPNLQKIPLRLCGKTKTQASAQLARHPNKDFRVPKPNNFHPDPTILHEILHQSFEKVEKRLILHSLFWKAPVKGRFKRS